MDNDALAIRVDGICSAGFASPRYASIVVQLRRSRRQTLRQTRIRPSAAVEEVGVTAEVLKRRGGNKSTLQRHPLHEHDKHTGSTSRDRNLHIRSTSNHQYPHNGNTKSNPKSVNLAVEEIAVGSR